MGFWLVLACFGVVLGLDIGEFGGLRIEGDKGWQIYSEMFAYT